MDIQEIENNAEFRIKFASINKRGGYDNDALEEYQSIFPADFGELSEGWQYESVGRVETRFEYDREAWALSHEGLSVDEIRFAAIEHETGIELVAIPILTGIVSGVATAALVELAKMMWKKWTASRTPNKLPSSLSLEKVESRNHDGSIQKVKKLEIRGPVDPETVTATVGQFFGAG